jgi:nitrous oxide reductase
MSSQDHQDRTPETADSPTPQMLQAKLSRRSMLRRGAFVGAAGLAVAAGGGGLAKVLSSTSTSDAGVQTAADDTSSGPIFIYIADPRSGEMDIFRGTGKTTHRNQAMASMVTSMAPR